MSQGQPSFYNDPSVSSGISAVDACGQPTESATTKAAEIPEWETMARAIVPQVEDAARKLQECDAKIADDQHTAKCLEEKDSALSAASEDFLLECNAEQAANIGACDSRLLGQEASARMGEISIVRSTASWLRGPVSDDNADARGVAYEWWLERLAVQADVQYGLCNARTQAAVLQAAPDELTLMVVGARSQALRAIAADAHRAVRSAGQALRELRERRTARDAARRATGTITRATIGRY